MKARAANLNDLILQSVLNALPPPGGRGLTYQEMRERVPHGNETIRAAIGSLVASNAAEGFRGDRGRKMFRRAAGQGALSA